MRIDGNGDIAQISKGIVDAHPLFDAHTHPEIHLTGGVFLIPETGFMLEIAYSRTQEDNILVAKFQTGVRIQGKGVSRQKVMPLTVTEEVGIQSD